MDLPRCGAAVLSHKPVRARDCHGTARRRVPGRTPCRPAASIEPQSSVPWWGRIPREAWGAAHAGAPHLRHPGHTVKRMAPQFVKASGAPCTALRGLLLSSQQSGRNLPGPQESPPRSMCGIRADGRNGINMIIPGPGSGHAPPGTPRVLQQAGHLRGAQRGMSWRHCAALLTAMQGEKRRQPGPGADTGSHNLARRGRCSGLFVLVREACLRVSAVGPWLPGLWSRPRHNTADRDYVWRGAHDAP
jgi:hypothetical protein